MEAGKVLVRRPGRLHQQVTCCCCDEGQGLTRCRDGPQVEAEEAKEAGVVLVWRPGRPHQQVTCCCCDEGQGPQAVLTRLTGRRWRRRRRGGRGRCSAGVLGASISR